MRRVAHLLLITIAAFALTICATAQSQNQSLGEYARAVKKTKPSQAVSAAPKVYDNDNLPAGASLSVVGNAPTIEDSADNKDKDSTKPADAKADGKTADDSKGDAKAADKKPEPQLKPGQPADERDQALDAYKKKLSGQKDKIALISRELDVLQREYQLKVAEFYSNSAARVQNPNGLVEVDGKYKPQIADKQKALDDANNELGNMQDEGRRSGAPNSVTE